MSAALAGRGLTRVFPTPSGEVHAVVDVDVEVRTGELLVVRGRSGAGKTTLLNLLGGLDRPTSGSVWLGERELTAMTEDEALAVRRQELAFIFQSFGLIPVLSAAENVEVPLRLRATANRTQWIDAGPPATQPSALGQIRAYRVKEVAE